jgi:RNA polymerase sigma factor (sigma-70 family)
LRSGPDAEEEQRRRYLFRIASHLVVDRWRLEQSERHAARDDVAADPAPEPAGHEEVARTFASLTPRERALLWLAYVEGHNHADIARSLGVGRQSVKVLLFRARARLRDLLESVGVEARKT